MLMPGMIVRRKKRHIILTVIDTSGGKVTCGWSQKGKFYKRSFNENSLIALTTSFQDVAFM